jgi:outer membrane protein assembly factor BamB
MVVGYDVETTKEDDYLEKLAFVCSDRYGSSKLAYYDELLQRDYSNIDVVESEEIKMPVESSVASMVVGPMDSAWSMKCHDVRHTSRSPYSTDDNPYDEKWQFKTDSWVEGGSVIDSDGTIYFGEMWGLLHALYPDGVLKWHFETDNLIWSTPAIAEDGTIYIGSYDTKLYAINPDGTEKWKIGTGGSIASSPAIAEDGTIYFGVLGPGDNGRICALYPNGTEKWHYDTGYWIVSDPAIGDDGTVYIGSGDTYLYAMNPDGTLKWRFGTGDWIQGPPSIADDGTIYIGSFDDYLYALYPNGTMKWKHPVGPGTETNPSIGSDGTIYVGSNKLYAIYPNGTLKWAFNPGADRFIASSSPAVSAEDTIYFGTNIGETDGGEIIAVNPDGTERWRKKIANDWVDSSPSIGEDGTVYIGTTEGVGEGGYFYAFGIGELEADANGPYYGLINEPEQLYGSASGGFPEYGYHWDFGDSNTSDEKNPTHIYSEAGNYTVTLSVTDAEDNTVTDTTYAWIQESNSPPSPPIITGPTHGRVGVVYEFKFVSIDPEGNDIWYYIQWEGASNRKWDGPYPSGAEITRTYSWMTTGTYTIKAKAMDWYTAESEWSEFKVTIPRNRIVTYNLLFLRFLEQFPLLERLLPFLF